MANISDRIKLFADNQGISIRQIESTIGASNGTISKSISKGTDFGAKWLEKIISAYPQLNMIWLLRGEGSMIVENFAQNKELIVVNNLHENLDKSNKMEIEQGNKTGNIAGNNGYILEENQGLDRVEEKEAQYHDKAIKHSKSEYFEFLKKEIAFKNKIIETLLQITMIKEEDIEAKVRKALRKNEDKPLITIVRSVEKEVLKTAKTKEEEQLIADIFVRILTRLSEEV